MHNSNNSNFFVGIGAMKAGTTWLHDYLHNRDDVFMPEMKELHYFNVRFRPEMSKKRIGRIHAEAEAAEAGLAKGQKVGAGLMREQLDRRAMETDPRAYRDFFLNRIKSEHKVFGEITPAYSLLPKAGMVAIKDLFPEAKAILLLRDPVSRYVSQLRFTDNSKYFEAFLDRPGFLERGAYDVIWRNLTSVFDVKDVYVGFYETLFQEGSVREICKFLGLPFAPADYGRRVNPSRASLELSEKQERLARKKFQHIYDFCNETFGSRVPDSWLIKG
jgi:hypothetical protein